MVDLSEGSSVNFAAHTPIMIIFYQLYYTFSINNMQDILPQLVDVWIDQMDPS